MKRVSLAKTSIGTILLVAMLMNVLPAYSLRKNQGLVVSPLRQKLTQEPGSTTAGSITLTNDTDNTLVVGLSTENFGVINENYDYTFKREDSAKWIQFTDQQLRLSPHEKKSTSYSLAIPGTATPGGYDIVLLATVEETPNGTDITEFRRVASLIYLDVNGKVEKKGTLLGFDAPLITTRQDTAYQLRIANQGNSHLDSRVLITPKAIIGGASESTQAQSFTLPLSVRHIDGVFRMSDVPGIYTVTATYSPPQGGLMRRKHTVIYAPWSFTLTVVASMAFIAFLIFERRGLGRFKKNQQD